MRSEGQRKKANQIARSRRCASYASPTFLIPMPNSLEGTTSFRRQKSTSSFAVRSGASCRKEEMRDMTERAQ